MDESIGWELKRAGYLVYLAFFLMGVVIEVRPHEKGFEMLMSLAIAWSLAQYCALDWRAHRRVFVRSYWVVSFASWPIAPLFLLLRSRGKRGALHYLKHGLLLSMFCVGGYLLGTIIELTGYPRHAKGPAHALIE